jgi:Fe-S cluster assembly ATP-binding protein
MLEIEDLSVEIGDRSILKKLSLHIDEGEVHALLGQNGSGKTTLLMVIMGMPAYKVTNGRIIFQGSDITGKTVDERARMGIGVAFQKPPSVRGIKTSQMVEICMDKKDEKRANEIAGRLNVVDLMDRDVNAGFSGGEAKRSEMLQLLAQNPSFAMFDEPESGVDLDNIALVGSAMNEILEKDRVRMKKAAGLIVTHTGHILDYVNADIGHILMDGTIVCEGNPRDLFDDIRAHGYEGCVECRRC